MTVFYSIYRWPDKVATYDYLATNWLGNLILEDDLSYWIVPGTLNLED